MSSYDSILHQLATSLRDHIFTQWHSELYAADGSVEQTGTVPAALTQTLSYTDRNKTVRVFGPSIVQVGRFQDDPLSLSGLMAVPSSYIQIRSNDPVSPGTWEHSLANDGSGMSDGAVRPLWTHELGGGSMHWRRFLVDFTIYTIDSDQTQSENHRLGTAALTFLESLCTSRGKNRSSWAWSLLDSANQKLVDPFGEQPIESVVVKSEIAQRGGPDTDTTGDYICDGKIWLQVLTHKGG